MTFTAEEADYFIRVHLGPALQRNGITTKILAWDHNLDDLAQADTILGNPRTAGYVAGTAFHCYKGDYTAQGVLAERYPNSEIHLTECSGKTADTFDGSLAWISRELVIGSIQNWSRSVLRWNLALNQNAGPQNGGCNNCRGILTIVDDAADMPLTVKQITNEVDYYALGHASKFVKDGAYRIQSTHSTGTIKSVAFQNPDRIVVLVVLNDGDTTTSFKVRSSNRMFTYTVPAGALATFVWPGASTPIPTFNIDGIALDANGTPIANAEFKVSRHLGSGKSLLGSISSDSTGHFQFSHLDSGTYIIEAVSATYQWLPVQRILSLPPAAGVVTFTAAVRGTTSAFVPSVQGYSFSNGRRATNWEIFRDTFGADSVEFSVAGVTSPLTSGKALLRSGIQMHPGRTKLHGVGHGRQLLRHERISDTLHQRVGISRAVSDISIRIQCILFADAPDCERDMAGDAYH